MFDLRDEGLTRVDKNSTPVDRIPHQGATVETPTSTHSLDTHDKRELHRLLLSYYRQELDRQSENRFQMAIDEDYYDNIQWSEEESRQLKERGQAPIVYNVIAQTINWVIGSEKRGRTDFKILPREKEDTQPAELKTKLLKYLSDVNRLPFARSRAFEDAIKVGLGWLEDGAQDEDDGEPIYSRYESWRNILHDSASTELDFSDGRYIFRSKWVDVDVAKALFPGREAQIDDAVVDASMYGSFDMVDGDVPMDYMEFDRTNYSVARTMVTHKRRRVRLIECEYRVPEKVDRLRGGVFKGEIYDAEDPRHIEAVQSGQSVVASKVMMRVRLAHMTVKDLLWEGPSPYRHNRFRFTPIWCYRRGRDNLPYGMIRSIRDIQDDVNKRASKALHILSSNKVIMDEGALPEGVTLDEFAEEVSRPDAIIVKRAGKELVINAERDLAAPHLELMSRGINMIQQVGGVTDELLGRTTNAVSGVAVQKRQEQGSLATNKPFDHLRLAAQMQGELQLSLLEQFCDQQKTFRITNERGTPDFIQINDGLPENEITRTKADFIISEADWRATMRQAAAEQLLEQIGKMPPQIGLLLLDLAVESMDLPNREEIAKRIRAATGMKDPDQTEPTPEDIAQQQANEEQAAAQKAMFNAELAGKQADAELKMAKVAREKGMTMKDRVDSTSAAMLSAQSVIAMPTIAKVADGILQEAGWQGFSASAVAPAGMQPQQVAQPEPQQAPQEPRQPIGMPPMASLGQSAPPPIGMNQPGGDSQAAVTAMKQISDGTMVALTEVSNAIATMAGEIAKLNKPKSHKVVIAKQADGSFVGQKVEE